MAARSGESRPPRTSRRSPSATASPTNGPAPLTVDFDGSGSSDPEGGPLTYAWDLDADGAFDDSTAVAPSHTYGVGGTYDVRLRVTDSLGASSVTTVRVSVNNTPAVGIDRRAGDRNDLEGRRHDRLLGLGDGSRTRDLPAPVRIYVGSRPPALSLELP